MAIKFLNTVQVDTDVLYVDTANDRVGIGTTSPGGDLHVVGAAGNAGRIYLSDKDQGSGGGDALLITKTGVNSFVYNRDSGDLGLGSNNQSSYVNIKSTGNVGIGTTSPGANLQIGTVNTLIQPALSFRSTAAASYGVDMDMEEVSLGYLAYYGVRAGSRTLGLVQSWENGKSGNVGIGTTSPGAKLQVEGDGIFNGPVIINEMFETLRLGTTLPTGGTYQTWYNASGRKGFFGYASSASDDIYLVNSEYSSIRLGTNGRTADFVLSADGNIGLGITSPGVKLVTATQNYSEGPTLGSGVVGGQALLATNGLFGQYSGVSGTTGHVWHQVQRNDSAVAYNMILQPAGGNIGIGTASPISILDLNKQYTASGLYEASELTLSANNGSLKWATGQVVGYVAAGASNSVSNFPGGLAFKTKNADGVQASIPTTKMVINAGGSVGIGTASPVTKLEISSVRPRIRLRDTTTNVAAGSTTGGIDFYTSDTSSEGNAVNAKIESYADSIYGRLGLRFFTGGAGAPTQAMTVNWAGSVGIGTTSPGAKLDIFNGGGNATSLSLAQTYSGLTVKPYSSVDSKLTFSANSGNTQIIQATNNSGTTGRQIALQPFSGNVGIGTTSPAEKLTVSGTDNYVAVQQSDYLWGMNITIGAKLGANSVSGILDMRRWTGSSTDHSVVAITQTNAQVGGYGLDFKVDSKSTNTVATTSRMFISTYGDVGIGTTTPNSKLEVDGGDIEVDDSASGLILRSPDGTRYRITVANGGTLSVAAV